MLLAQVVDPISWPANLQLGITATLLLWLVVKGNPKQRDDERADKVAIALAAAEAMALVKAEQKEQTERHQKAFHDERERWQALLLNYETQILKLTEEMIETRHSLHAAAETGAG